MPTCIPCGADKPSDSPHCTNCGEASWSDGSHHVSAAPMKDAEPLTVPPADDISNTTAQVEELESMDVDTTEITVTPPDAES